MRIIINSIIPIKGMICINIFGIVFVRLEKYLEIHAKYKTSYYWKTILNHEEIHTKQMQELLYIFFYVWYGIEWFLKLLYYLNAHKAYRNISFEREAYDHEKDFEYIKQRKHYSWIKLLFKL